MFLNCRLINLTCETNEAFRYLFYVFLDFSFFYFSAPRWVENQAAILVDSSEVKKRFDAEGMCQTFEAGEGKCRQTTKILQKEEHRFYRSSPLH